MLPTVPQSKVYHFQWSISKTASNKLMTPRGRQWKLCGVAWQQCRQMAPVGFHVFFCGSSKLSSKLLESACFSCNPIHCIDGELPCKSLTWAQSREIKVIQWLIHKFIFTILVETMKMSWKKYPQYQKMGISSFLIHSTIVRQHWNWLKTAV